MLVAIFNKHRVCLLMYVPLLVACSRDVETEPSTREPERVEERDHQPREKALSAWIELIAQAKQNIPNCDEYWRATFETGGLWVTIVEDDVQESTSLKSQFIGNVRLKALQSQAYELNGSSREYRLRFAWTEEKWRFLDGVRLPDSPVSEESFNGGFLKVLFGPNDEALTARRLEREKVAEAWPPYVMRIMQSAPTRLGAMQRIEWRVNFFGRRTMRGQWNFKLYDEKILAGAERVYIVEMKFVSGRWIFHSGECIVDGQGKFAVSRESVAGLLEE